MRSRAVRVTLALLAFAAAGTAAYFYWTSHERMNAALDTAAAFTVARESASRAALDIRSAQQAYVAAGQNEAFWFQKVSTSIDSLRSALAELDRVTTSSEARAALSDVSATVKDFEEGDRRVRNYVSSDQRLLASDIIFSDGFELTSHILESLDRAAELSRKDVTAARAAAQREQLIAAGAAVGVGLFVVLLLAPVRSQPDETGSSTAAQPAPHKSLDLDLRPAAAPIARPEPQVIAAAKPVPVSKPAPKEPVASVPPRPEVELGDLARVCTELARLSDSAIMPAILERAASALHAAGLVLWVANGERKELVPIAAHGYAPNVLARMGAVPTEDENATGAAFRTGLVQTVRGGEKSNGAIAAPLVSPAGVLGVLSVEVRDGGEKEPARRAAASIVAAQLATLVAPADGPGAKPESQAQPRA